MSQSQSQTQQSRDSAQFQLRLPDDLKSRIEEAAKGNARSINSEIVEALTQKYLPSALVQRAAKSLLQYIDPEGNMTQQQIIETANKIILNQGPLGIDRKPDGSLEIDFEKS